MVKRKRENFDLSEHIKCPHCPIYASRAGGGLTQHISLVHPDEKAWDFFRAPPERYFEERRLYPIESALTAADSAEASASQSFSAAGDTQTGSSPPRPPSRESASPERNGQLWSVNRFVDASAEELFATKCELSRPDKSYTACNLGARVHDVVLDPSAGWPLKADGTPWNGQLPAADFVPQRAKAEAAEAAVGEMFASNEEKKVHDWFDGPRTGQVQADKLLKVLWDVAEAAAQCGDVSKVLRLKNVRDANSAIDDLGFGASGAWYSQTFDLSGNATATFYFRNAWDIVVEDFANLHELIMLGPTFRTARDGMRVFDELSDGKLWFEFQVLGPFAFPSFSFI
jgi:hypothetical protein